MISKPLPKPKKSTPAVPAKASVGHGATTACHIAHELRNQLTVLYLVTFNIVSRKETRSPAEIARDTEIFERTFCETTLLVEQLAYNNAVQRGNQSADQPPTIPDQAQAVRLLRSVLLTDR